MLSRQAARVLTRNARLFSSSAPRQTKVAVLGASGGIGQPLSLLLKLDPLVSSLSLYDIRLAPGVAADVSHIDTPGEVLLRTCVRSLGSFVILSSRSKATPQTSLTKLWMASRSSLSQLVFRERYVNYSSRPNFLSLGIFSRAARCKQHFIYIFFASLTRQML